MAELHILSGTLGGQVYRLTDKSITIGRASDNAICIEEPFVSKHHAVLIGHAESYTLRDLSSTNGTLVNGMPAAETTLRSGDVIQVGSFEMRYESETEESVRAIPAKGAETLTTVAQVRSDMPTGPATNSALAEYTIAEQGDNASTPIPSRLATALAWAQSRTQNRIPAESYPRPAIRFEISYSTGADEFVRAARKMVSRNETTARFVPFMCYWPTYGSMSEAQLNWYFCWRGRVRNGEYPDSDLSYVFVHVYELINNVGVKDETDGYEQLRRLWVNYRQRQPKLDNYLVDWIADYLIVNSCPVDPLQVYQEAFDLNASLREADILLPKYLDRTLTEIPMSLIALLTDYRIGKSKFYVQGNQVLVDGSLPKVLHRVDSFLREKSRAGIFETFKPSAQRAIQRSPFQSAVYAGKEKQITIATVFPYSHHRPMRDFLTGLVKHTENQLRELRNYKGRLRGYTLPPDVAAAVEAFVVRIASPQPERVRVDVDFARVEELTRASDQVRDILLAGKDAVKPGEHRRMPEPFIDDTAIARPEGTPAHLLTDLVAVNRVLAHVDTSEKQLLESFMKHQWEMDDAQLTATLPGVLLERAIDHLNELALKFIGDILVATDGEKRIVADDYRDEIEYLIAQKAKQGLENAQPGKPIPDLPQGWADFFSQLKDHQLRALKVISARNGALEEIRRIAAECEIMPEVLIDSINELALATIGDIIIDTSSVPPIIEDEDFEMVQKLTSVST